MGFFGRDKMSNEAGEWAATAMGCMVFADGSPDDAEIAAAKAQVAANPVIKDTIGTAKALELFGATVEAIRHIPSTMLASYEVKLGGLAQQIKKTDERNFALSTVVAIAMGDTTLTQAEYAMMARFREMLGATIPIPQPGKQDPARAPVQSQKGASAKAPTDVSCSSCKQPTRFFPGYGHWCSSCNTYADASASATTGKQSSTTATASTFCGYCGKATRYYEGYGHWCAPCQKYTKG